MASSLRRTLAVRYSLTMAVALLAIAVWAYWGMRATLLDQLDQSLRSTLELQAVSLAADGRIPTLPFMEEQRFVTEVNRLVVGRDDRGRIVQANRDFAVDLPLDSVAFRSALAGRLSPTDGAWRGRKARTLYGPAPASATSVAVLEVAASLAPLENASRQVLYRMVATAALGALASLIGAAWLAHSALAPVQDIATQARAIHGGLTGQRITAHVGVTELQGLIEVLNEMLARLERSHEWHRRLIRDLGHDLRTPITTMRAAVEMALWSERRPDQYREVLASTLEEIDRLTLIGDGLSLLASLESGDLTPALVEADLRTVASQAVDRARARVGGHEIRFERPQETLPARLDPRLMGMVLDQLLDNARHHTPPGTRVEVTVAGADGEVSVTVEDQGPGVPDEMLSELFTHFYRGDPARGRHAGPGLGLTLAAAIVDLHRGRITAERADGGGLRIRIALPLVSASGPPARGSG